MVVRIVVRLIVKGIVVVIGVISVRIEIRIVIIVIIIINRIAVTVRNMETTIGTITSTESTDAINDFSRHRQRSPVVAVEFPTSGKTEKEISTLWVPSRAEGKGAGGTAEHGVVVFLVCLNIGTEFKLAMGTVGDGGTNNNSTRAEDIRHTGGSRKTVEPKCAIIHQFNDHAGR